MERKISRRDFLIIGGTALADVVLSACDRALSPLLPTPTKIEPTPTPNWVQRDLDIKRTIEESKVGESLTLKNVLIGSIVTLSRGGQAFYITSIDALGWDGEPHFVAAVASSDCVFDALKAEGKLGPSSTVLLVGRKWHPLARVDSLSLKRDVYSATPLFNATGLTQKDKSYSCKVSTLPGGLQEILKNLREK